jgi:hypothetical protein
MPGIFCFIEAVPVRFYSREGKEGMDIQEE